MGAGGCGGAWKQGSYTEVPLFSAGRASREKMREEEYAHVHAKCVYILIHIYVFMRWTLRGDYAGIIYREIFGADPPHDNALIIL